MKNFFTQYGLARQYWIAYSGGMDSQVLLNLCHQARIFFPSLSLQAIYIHHGLHPQAGKWGEHCRKSCEALNVNYREIAITLSRIKKKSLEAIAREKRYAMLAACLAKDDMLLTAHHQDDQAETVLLQLFRGAGPKGVAGMPSIKSLENGFHARPLLFSPRRLLHAYAKKHALQWVEDPTNQQLNHARNFIRQKAIPLLQERWPSINILLARSATHCAALQTIAETHIQQLFNLAKGSKPHTLSVKILLTLSKDECHEVLRRWVQETGFLLPSSIKIQHLYNNVLLAARDKQPCVTWQNIEVRRYRDDLYIMRSLKPLLNRFQPIVWEMKAPLFLSHGGQLVANEVKGQGLICPTGKVKVRLREGGERIWRHGCHHSLKHFFQEQAVLPWWRERLPLIWMEQTLVSIPDLFLDERFSAREERFGYEIKFVS